MRLQRIDSQRKTLRPVRDGGVTLRGATLVGCRWEGIPPRPVRDRCAIRYRAPDNGGASGAAYLLETFGARLPDPFRPAVSTGLAPPTGSLRPVPDVLAPFVVVAGLALSVWLVCGKHVVSSSASKAIRTSHPCKTVPKRDPTPARQRALRVAATHRRPRIGAIGDQEAHALESRRPRCLGPRRSAQSATDNCGRHLFREATRRTNHHEPPAAEKRSTETSGRAQPSARCWAGLSHSCQ